VAVLGTDAAKVLLFIPQELNALDNDGVFEEFAFEDGLGEDGIELCIALFDGAGEPVARCVQKLSVCGARKSGCGCSGQGSGEERSAAGWHGGLLDGWFSIDDDGAG